MASGEDILFACACGGVTGTLTAVTPANGGQLHCHCSDCRRALIWLGQDDPAPLGVHYFQTTPDHLHFDQGGGTLKAFHWKNPRLLRWYAPCCNTALFNTLDSPKWPFVSMVVAQLAQKPPGPDRTHAFITKPNGKRGNIGLLPFLAGFAKRTLAARLSGRWRQTPLFDLQTGAAKAEVQVLTKADRDTAPLPQQA